VEDPAEIPDFPVDLLKSRLAQIVQLMSTRPSPRRNGDGKEEKEAGEFDDFIEVEISDEEDGDDEGDGERDRSRSRSNSLEASSSGKGAGNGNGSGNGQTRSRSSDHGAGSSSANGNGSGGKSMKRSGSSAVFNYFQSLLSDFRSTMESIGALSLSLKAMEQERNRCLTDLGAKRVAAPIRSLLPLRRGSSSSDSSGDSRDSGDATKDRSKKRRKSSIMPQLSVIKEGHDGENSNGE
jgi:hypothetical protein